LRYAQTPQNQNRWETAFAVISKARRPATTVHKFFAKQKTYSSKMAWMPFLSSARDRSGILFCRRQKRYKRIARFPALRAGNAPKIEK
jgi:hypothetical protein